MRHAAGKESVKRHEPGACRWNRRGRQGPQVGAEGCALGIFGSNVHRSRRPREALFNSRRLVRRESRDFVLVNRRKDTGSPPSRGRRNVSVLIKTLQTFGRAAGYDSATQGVSATRHVCPPAPDGTGTVRIANSSCNGQRVAHTTTPQRRSPAFAGLRGGQWTACLSRCRGSCAAVQNATGGAACAAPWPRSGGCARG